MALSNSGRTPWDLLVGGVLSAASIGGAVLFSNGFTTTLAGVVVGSSVTYLVQSRAQRRIWMREDRLFLAREVYSPLQHQAGEVLALLKKVEDSLQPEHVFGGIFPDEALKVTKSEWFEFADVLIREEVAHIIDLLSKENRKVSELYAYYNDQYWSDLVGLIGLTNLPPQAGRRPLSTATVYWELNGREVIDHLQNLLWKFEKPPTSITKIFVNDDKDSVHKEVLGGFDEVWEGIYKVPSFVNTRKEILKLRSEIRDSAETLQDVAQSRVRSTFSG